MKTISSGFISELQRAFGIRGGASLSLLEEIAPVAIINDLRAPHLAQRGGGSWGVSPAVGVGAFSTAMLFNPLTSSVIAVVTGTIIRAPVSACVLSSGVDAIDPMPPLGAVVATRPGDTRRMVSTATRNQVQGSSATVAPVINPALLQLVVPGGNNILHIPFCAVLGKGGWLAWQCQGANETIHVSFSWDEYELG